jgi:hypothetical protein
VIVNSMTDDTFFFMHIPKTAGTSLRALLEQRFNKNEICPISYVTEFQNTPDPTAYLKQYRFIRGHLPYDYIRRLLGYDPITLTMLRHPVDRLVSNWAFFQELVIPEGLVPPKYMMRARTLSLEEFVAEIVAYQQPGTASKMGNIQTIQLGADTQTLYSKEDSEDVVLQHSSEIDLACAKQVLPTFAWVGLTERYEDSLALMAYTFGWWPVRTIRRLNVTARRPQLSQLSPTLLDQCNAICQLDLQLYEHAVELFNQRYLQMCSDLLERYGSREHAHLWQPLSGEALMPLLERHFADRFAAREQQSWQGAFGLNRPFDGEGWYDIEQTGAGEFFRWSGPDRETQIIVPLQPGVSYMFSLRIIHALSLETLHSLQMWVNGTLMVLTASTEPDSATRFTTCIPADALTSEQPFARIEFLIDQTIQPEGDSRKLGLAFGEFRFEPTEHTQ